MHLHKVIPLLLLPIVICACVPDDATTPTEEPTGSASSTPEASPETSVPLAIALIPPDLDQESANLYQTTIYDLTQEQGMRFQTRSALTDYDVQNEPGLLIVIAFAPDPGLNALAAAAPDVQFLGVDLPGLSPAENLSLIGGDDRFTIQQAFVAGYMASMLSPDYRVGLITRDSDAGRLSIDAFSYGREYFCGLCQASFPPWYEYPVHPQIPENTPLTQYPAHADYLFDQLVDVTYVDPLVATPELIDYMALNGMMLIGEELPFEDVRPNWVASIQADIIPAIQELWPDLLAGAGGQRVAIPLSLEDVNVELLSEGKQRLVDELLQDLQADRVSTGVEP